MQFFKTLFMALTMWATEFVAPCGSVIKVEQGCEMKILAYEECTSSQIKRHH
jgi:hypothetical protein